MSLKEMHEMAEGRQPPEPGSAIPAPVALTTPGGLAVLVFADGGALVRVCLGLVDDAEDGLAVEVRSGAEPTPWSSKSVRDEAIAELRRRTADAEGKERAALARLVEHVLRTPYYENR